MNEKRPDPLRKTRDFLYQIRDQQRRIHNLEKRIELRKQADTRWENEIRDLEERIRSAKEEYTEMLITVSDKISCLEDDRYQMVLTLRYIDMVSDWNDIASQMGMSKAAVQKLHGQALPLMKMVLEEG